MLYGVRSERMLIEQLGYNLLFRGFVARLFKRLNRCRTPNDTKNGTADDYPQKGCMKGLSFREWHKSDTTEKRSDNLEQ